MAAETEVALVATWVDETAELKGDSKAVRKVAALVFETVDMTVE